MYVLATLLHLAFATLLHLATYRYHFCNIVAFRQLLDSNLLKTVNAIIIPIFFVSAET